jgi:hypothetical protein
MANPIRPCIGCGQSDDAPRDHVVVGDKSVFWHHDCHAAVDPPCPSCEWLVKHKGSLKGDDWRSHVIALHAELSQEQREQAPWDRDVVKSHLNGKVAK